MRRTTLTLVLAGAVVVACGRTGFDSFGEEFGDGSGTTMDTDATTASTSLTTTGVPDMGEAETATGDGDGDSTTGDGDGDTTGDGDGDTTGDGDGDTTGDGDGDTTGDGDGDTTGGPGCGNGIIDPGEQCDGDNLDGFSCQDLGYVAGSLACDPVVCVFDASDCISMGTTGGTTGF